MTNYRVPYSGLDCYFPGALDFPPLRVLCLKSFIILLISQLDKIQLKRNLNVSNSIF